MATWATITASEFVTEGFNADERTKLQSAAGGDDGLSSILAAAIAEWRGIIQAAGATLDSSATTIPPSCRRHIIAQVRWQVLVKFPALKQLQTEERKAAAEKADEVLADIATGDRPVESPDDEETDSEPSPGITTRTRTFTRDDQDGL